MNHRNLAYYAVICPSVCAADAASFQKSNRIFRKMTLTAQIFLDQIPLETTYFAVVNISIANIVKLVQFARNSINTMSTSTTSVITVCVHIHNFCNNSMCTTSLYLLPPVNKVCEGFVFTGVCLSTGEGGVCHIQLLGPQADTPWADTPGQTPPRQTPPWADNPLGQTPPLGR